MSIRDACFDKVLGLTIVLTFAEGVTLRSQSQSRVDQSLSHIIKVHKHSPRVGVIVQCFVQVSSMVDSLYDQADDL